MSLYYDKDGTPITLGQWSILHRNYDYKRVALTKLGDVEISTVWLGLDHNFGPTGPPLIFETLIFGGDLDGEGGRWSTYQDAIEGHRRFVEECGVIEGTVSPEQLNSGEES